MINLMEEKDLVLSWMLNRTNCTLNSLIVNFGVFDFCNFSQSTIKNSMLTFPRFIGGNFTGTKLDDMIMNGGDFYGVIGRNLEIRN